MGHAYANYFNKAYIVSYRKMPKKKKITVLFPGKTPLKLEEIPPKNQTILMPYLLQAQPALILQ